MASFNERFQSGGVPDFTNRVRIPKSNLGANLFSFAGNLVQAGLSQQENNKGFALDSAISQLKIDSTNQAIENQLSKLPGGEGFSQPSGNFNTQFARDGASVSDQSLIEQGTLNSNREIAQSAERFNNARNSVIQGTASSRAIDTQMAAELKRLRNKFPDAESQAKIDRLFVSIGNAKLKQITAEVTAFQTAETKKEAAWVKLITNPDNSAWLSEHYPDIFSNPNKFSGDAIRSTIRTGLLKETGRKQELKDINLQASSDAAIRKEEKITASFKIFKNLSSIPNDAVVSMKRLIEEQAPGVLSGKISVSAKDALELNQQLTVKKKLIEAKLRQAYNDSVYNFSNEEVNSQIEKLMGPFNTVKSLVSDEDYKGASAAADILKATIQDQQTLLGRNPTIALSSALNAMKLSTSVLERLDADLTGELNRTEGLIARIAVGKFVDKGGSLSTMIQDLQKIEGKSPKQIAASIKSSIQQVSDTLKDPNVSPDSFNSFVEKVYGKNENIFQEFSGTAQEEIWQMFTHPDILKRIVASGPENLFKYNNWVKSQIPQLKFIKELSDNMSTNFGTLKEYGDIQISKEGKIIFTVDREGLNRLEFSNVTDTTKSETRKAVTSINDGVNQINKVLSNMIPLFKVNGEDVPTAIKQTLENMRLNTDNQTGSILSSIGKFLDDAVQVTNTERKLGSKQSKDPDPILSIISNLPGNEGVSIQKLQTILEKIKSSNIPNDPKDIEALRKEFLPFLENLVAKPDTPRVPVIESKSGPSKETPFTSGEANARGEGIVGNPPGTVTDREAAPVDDVPPPNLQDTDNNALSAPEGKDIDKLSPSEKASSPVPIPRGRPADLGKDTKVNVTVKGNITFYHPKQDNLNPEFRNVLLSVAEQIGPLGITSGFRSSAYNKKVGGARNSFHTKGLAADIDMSSLDEDTRVNLVRALARKGINGFITYSKSPNMLHVDRRAKTRFMFDKTKSKISKAPAWFQTLAKELE